MKKIATHNSATGESGKGWLSTLVAVFSKCQSKTIKQQWAVGCRLFDIRVRWDKKRKAFVAAHGLWTAERNVYAVLAELNSIARKGKSFYLLTYEGRCVEGSEEYARFMEFAYTLNTSFANLECVQIAVKKPQWQVIANCSSEPIDCKAEYEKLVKGNWKMLIPVPWLWAKLRRVEFEEDTYKMVDFL